MFLLYLINPFLPILLRIGKNSRWKFLPYNYLYLFLCILSVTFVNILKVPENDLAWYVLAYERAYGISLIEYLPKSGIYPWAPCTDYGYVLYVWLLSNLTKGNIYIFLFLTSFVEYLFLGLSIIIFCKKLNISQRHELTAITIMCFFPWIFTMSLHLVRQFIAGAFMVYLVSKILYDNDLYKYIRRNWWMVFLMFLFHKSSLFFLVLIFCRFLDENWQRRKFLYFGFAFALVAYQFVASIFLPYLGEDNAVALAVSRASEDTTYELASIDYKKYAFISVMGFVAFLVGYTSRLTNKYRGLKHICNIIIVSVLFVFQNHYQLELSNRFYFYILPFLPFIYLFITFYYRISETVSKLISAGCIALWIIYINYGVWTYDINPFFFLMPIPFYYLQTSYY